MMTGAGVLPIVVGTDGSDAAQAAVEYAADLAARRSAPLRVVHAFEPSEYEMRPPVDWHRDRHGVARNAAQRMLDDTLEVLTMVYPQMQVRVRLEPGLAVGVLVEESRNADTVVLGSRGSGGFVKLLLGSTPLAVAAQSHCPVVAVPAPKDSSPDRHGVVVGVDRTPGSECALEYAFRVAAETGEPLLAVRAWSEPFRVMTGLRLPLLHDPDVVREQEGHDLMDTVVRWQEKFPGVTVTAEVVVGHAAKVLLDLSRDARLLVVGCRGQGDIRAALVGSTSHAVLHHTEVPVAVVPFAGGGAAVAAPGRA